MTASILPGLCSVTFRRLSAAAVIDLAARCGLTGIEWGAMSTCHRPISGGPSRSLAAAPMPA